MQAKTWTYAALLAAWLGTTQGVWAQGYPMMAPPPGPPGMPHGPGTPSPLAMMPPGHGAPGHPGMPPPGMPPGMRPPGFPPVGTGIPGNLTREVERNAWTGVPDEPEVCNPVRWHFMWEPLLIWIKGQRLPPTVTTGDFFFDPVPGALGQPGTKILNGGERFDAEASFGSRLTLVYWLADPERLSVDVSYFRVETRTNVFDVRSDPTGQKMLTRPFFNPVAGAQDADPRALPFLMRGNVHDEARTDYQGAEANLRWNLSECGTRYGYDWILITGPRWIQLDEHYSNRDTVAELPEGLANTYTFSDRFATSNQFYGGTLGMQYRGRWDRLTIDLVGKVIAGINDQSVRIEGFTRQVDPFGNVTFDNRQGLYVQPSNSGSFDRQRFSWGNEFGTNFGFLLNDNFRFSVGYTFFFLTNVARAGDQIDTTVNIQPLLSGGGFGVARPRPLFRDDTFVTHTINFGFEFLY